MSNFPIQTADTASDAARPLLEGAQKSFGFVPNLLGTMANAPALLEAYMTISQLFGKTSFSPTEQQVIALSASFENGCDYCMAAHSTIANMQKVDGAVVESLRAGQPIADPKLEALRLFTTAVVESRGYPTDAEVADFLGAGYTRENILEVVLGVGMKTLSNYTNHLASTPLDDAFSPQAWKKAS